MRAACLFVLAAVTHAAAVVLTTTARPTRCATRAARVCMQADEVDTLRVVIEVPGGGGIGVGLDKDNKVDLLKPGMPAEKVLRMGDKITFWNDESMVEIVAGREVQRKLKDVVTPQPTHTVTIERVTKPWESSSWETTYGDTNYQKDTDWSSTSWGS